MEKKESRYYRLPEALQDLLAEYEAIIQGFDGLIYICSKNYDVEFMNQMAIERGGSYAVGQKCYQVLHSLENVCPRCANDRVFKGEKVILEVLSPKDNRWYHVVNTPIHHPDGTISNMALLRDITERKQAEEALRQVNETLRATLDAVPAAIVDLDNEGRVKTLWNPAAEQMLGWRRDEVLGQFLPTVSEESKEEFAEVRKWLLSGKPIMGKDAVRRRKDGSRIEYSIYATPKYDEEAQVSGAIAVLVDITERKLAEQQAAKLAAIVRSSDDAIISVTLDGIITSWNKGAENIYGYHEGEVVGQSATLLAPPGIKDEVPQILNKIKQGEPVEHYETVRRRKDGQDIYMSLTISPIRDGEGRIVAASSIGRDITERKRMEEQIRNSEKNLHTIIETIPAFVRTANPEGSIDFVSQSWLDYMSISREEWVGWGWINKVHPEDRDRVVESRRQMLATGEPRERELRIRQANGEYRWFLSRHEPLRDEKGNIIKWYGVIVDIEARKRAETRLRQALDEVRKLQEQLSKENIVLREEVDSTSMFEEIVGASPALKTVLARLNKVAPTDSIVFITGETGSGKELVARAIHKRSPRSSRAFVSVNCAAIPAPLIASELFGHEKGAFTGAHQRRLGRFELAEGGTIFLDEIGELPMETQIALLRVLQDQEFERLGGNRPIRANVRVITATNRDLKAAIEAGSFRSDLFYRLNVFPIEVPPLRERKEDIPLLVEYFIHRYSSKLGKKIRSVGKKTLDLLQSYSWPGNIRELQNVIERSIIVCDTEIFSVEENWLVQESGQAQPVSQPLSDLLVIQAKEMIEAALAESGGRVSGPSGAAAKLGMPPSTLESKIKSLKINKHLFKTS